MRPLGGLQHLALQPPQHRSVESPVEQASGQGEAADAVDPIRLPGGGHPGQEGDPQPGQGGRAEGVARDRQMNVAAGHQLPPGPPRQVMGEFQFRQPGPETMPFMASVDGALHLAGAAPAGNGMQGHRQARMGAPGRVPGEDRLDAQLDEDPGDAAGHGGNTPVHRLDRADQGPGPPHGASQPNRFRLSRTQRIR